MANNDKADGDDGGETEVSSKGSGVGDHENCPDPKHESTLADHSFTEVELETDKRETSSKLERSCNSNDNNNIKVDNLKNSIGSGQQVANNVQKQNSDHLIRGPDRRGWVRHLVAVLALSSIVLANMNRQSFNQSLVSMIKATDKPCGNSAPANLASNATELPGEIPAATATVISATTTPMLATEPATASKSEGGNATAEATTVEPESRVESNGDDAGDDDDRFDWTGAQIATLQAAFSYGYTPFMIPGGRMSELYGAKWVVFMSGFGSALCCALAPFFADANYNLLVASRVVMGLCQTGVSPALYALLTRWLPPNESSVYLPMIKVAVMVGFMMGSLVSGFFTWRLTFYLVSLIGMLWSAMWALVVSSDPCEHKFIGKRELDYIRCELQRSNKGRKVSMDAARKAAAPWISILTNPVVVGFMLTKFTVKLSSDAQTMQIPMYLKNVFKVSKELNGMLSALNFAIQGIFTGLVAWLAKEFVVRKSYGLNKTGVRRLFQGICNFGMALAYILITFNMSSLVIVCCAVILLSVASMFGAGGEAVTPVDLSTDYSASIMAIANSSANLSGIILPSLVSFVLGDQLGSSERWNLVWWLVGGIIMAGGLVYTCRVNAEIQDFTSANTSKMDDKIAREASPAGAIEMKSSDEDFEKDNTTYV